MVSSMVRAPKGLDWSTSKGVKGRQIQVIIRIKNWRYSLDVGNKGKGDVQDNVDISSLGDLVNGGVTN